LKSNGIHQFLVCADNVRILCENLIAIKKYTEVLLQASREVGLEVNTEETKCIYGQQKGVQNYNLIIANKPLKMWQS
jgi:hypothetical protein